MSKPLNLFNKRFGKLIVIQQVDSDEYGKSQWLCICDCKNKTIVQGSRLKRGHTMSCGCLIRKHAKEMGLKNTKHGHKRFGRPTRIYVIWQGIIQRCCNSSNRQYNHYGGRGIKVCRRWLRFENFLEDMGEPSVGYQIDRTNNNKGYSKKNCQWVTSTINNQNKRNNILLTLYGRTQCVASWSREINLSVQGIMWRIKHGWSTKKALTTPVRKYAKNVLDNYQTMCCECNNKKGNKQ